MRDTIVRLLVVAAAAGFGVDCFRCPNRCFCYVWEGLLKTDCVRRNLINTFIGISHRTEILDLSHNVISILHGNEFSDANLRLLQDLRLSNNKLHKIDKFSFNGLLVLTNLDLSFNSIEYLHPSMFKYNPNLKTLNLSSNPLGMKKDEPFLSPASSLQTLDVASCHLEFIGPATFSELINLSVLNISRNHIRNVQLSERMQKLRYLDVSRNDLPCDGETNAFLQTLMKRKIQFQAFCQTDQKMLMFPMVQTKEATHLEVDLYKGSNETVRQQRSFYKDIVYFFQSIPSFYAIVCSVQVGIFIGSFSTYFCLKKSSKRHAEQEDVTAEGTSYRHGESDNPTFALIPLNTPPGTPPSPYRSRFFPSNFSISAT